MPAHVRLILSELLGCLDRSFQKSGPSDRPSSRALITGQPPKGPPPCIETAMMIQLEITRPVRPQDVAVWYLKACFGSLSSIPQLPSKRPQIPSYRGHDALKRGPGSCP